MSRGYSKTLEISGPTAACGHCQFTSALSGKWSVEDGILVWRADGDPLASRGPGLESCCESSPVVRFAYITVDGDDLGGDQITVLRETADRARGREGEWGPH